MDVLVTTIFICARLNYTVFDIALYRFMPCGCVCHADSLTLAHRFRIYTLTRLLLFSLVVNLATRTRRP